MAIPAWEENDYKLIKCWLNVVYLPNGCHQFFPPFYMHTTPPSKEKSIPSPLRIWALPWVLQPIGYRGDDIVSVLGLVFVRTGSFHVLPLGALSCHVRSARYFARKKDYLEELRNDRHMMKKPSWTLSPVEPSHGSNSAALQQQLHERPQVKSAQTNSVNSQN